MPRAPLLLKEISKDPDRTLASIDPRRSETAEIADIHVALRPGTDALLIKAMITIILENGWEKTTYLKDHVAAWEQVLPWFKAFDVEKALHVCGPFMSLPAIRSGRIRIQRRMKKPLNI